MFSTNESDHALSFRLSSSMELVDRVINTMSTFVNSLDHSFGLNNLTTVARELLVNAVEHGNMGDKTLEISVDIERIAEARYRLSVTDQGNGLDPNILLQPTPFESTSIRSRGLALANIHADELICDPDKRTVTAYVTLLRESIFTRSEKNGTMVIVPHGDITATIAENFRTELIAWYDSNNPDLVLDMSETRDVDSVCLSVLVSLCNMPGVAQGNRHIRLEHASLDLVNLMTLTRLNRLINVVSQGGIL